MHRNLIRMAHERKSPTLSKLPLSDIFILTEISVLLLTLADSHCSCNTLRVDNLDPLIKATRHLRDGGPRVSHPAELPSAVKYQGREQNQEKMQRNNTYHDRVGSPT